jgi:hypothetical protein
VKCLSIRQPWADAVLYGGKRIENRVKWKNGHYRGPLLIHAAKGLTVAEYNDACNFMAERKLWAPWHRDSRRNTLVRGAIIGRCNLVDVIYPGGRRKANDEATHSFVHPLATDRWYMGGFALVLDDVEAFDKPIPYKGMLGLFDVPWPIAEAA